MTCQKIHTETDKIVESLPISQGGMGRHKCASCAYEAGFTNGQSRNVKFDINGFIDRIEESQKGVRRHKDPLEAYSLGFFHGLNGKSIHEVINDRFKLSTNMAQFGLTQVGKGLYECTFAEDTRHKHAISTVHVASGFELIVKARIAQEHPYLIFEKLPTQAKVKDGIIRIDDLLEHGHTITYPELPDRLWVTTACRIPEIELFKKFGKIRNQIIHFSSPEEDFAKLVFDYCFKVIEPLVDEWWGVTLIDFAWDYDDAVPQYIFEQIGRYGLSTNFHFQDNLLKRKT